MILVSSGSPGGRAAGHDRDWLGSSNHGVTRADLTPAVTAATDTTGTTTTATARAAATMADFPGGGRPRACRRRR